jgi:1,4-dihydroxy-2-naphthoate octaprenyltransferase
MTNIMTKRQELSKFQIWFNALRPKTLPASIVPVLIGASAAYSFTNFNFPLAFAVLFCSLLIQILTNFVNEIYDYKKGADTDDRKGPTRAVAAGLISPVQMRNASIFVALLCFSLGLYVVASSSWIILLVGLFSLLCAYLYTGGPFPLAYKGLGDLFVLIFFGLVAVNGTYFVFKGNLNFLVFHASLIPGFMSMNILGVNNIRDIDTDKLVNKKTMAVRLGREKAILLYKIIGVSSLLVSIIMALHGHPIFLLPLLSTPLMIKIFRKIDISYGMQMNPLLAETGKILVIQGVLLSISFVIYNYITKI